MYTIKRHLQTVLTLLVGIMLGVVGLSIALTTQAPVYVHSSSEVRFPDGVRPCPFEDGGSKHRCVWDAKHSGNGEGDSLLIRGGGVDVGYRVINHGRAHRLVNRWEQS